MKTTLIVVGNEVSANGLARASLATGILLIVMLVKRFEPFLARFVMLVQMVGGVDGLVTVVRILLMGGPLTTRKIDTN